MNVRFSSRAWAEYSGLPAADAKLTGKIHASIAECRRHPFRGTGKPEPLDGNLSGWRSRRISHEHRLVYRVTGAGEAQELQVAQLPVSLLGGWAGRLVLRAPL